MINSYDSYDTYVSWDGKRFRTPEERDAHKNTPEYRAWEKKQDIRHIEESLAEDLERYDEAYAKFEEKYPEFNDGKALDALLETEEGRAKRMALWTELDELDELLFRIINDSDIIVKEFLDKYPEEEKFRKLYYESIRPQIDEDVEQEWNEKFGFTIPKPTLS